MAYFVAGEWCWAIDGGYIVLSKLKIPAGYSMTIRVTPQKRNRDCDSHKLGKIPLFHEESSGPVSHTYLWLN